MSYDGSCCAFCEDREAEVEIGSDYCRRCNEALDKDRIDDEKISAIHDLRETIKYLLRTPDLNLDCLEEDTIIGIEKARTALKETDMFCPFNSIFKRSE